MQESSSVPGSPSIVRRNSRSRRFSWRQDLAVVGRSTTAEFRPRRADEPLPPLVTPCLDNLDLPYADDDPISSTSLADGNVLPVRSASPRRAPAPSAPSTWGGTRRRSSTRRQSILARAQSIRRPGRGAAGSGRARAASQQTGPDLPRHRDRRAVPDDRKGEPTHFRWNASVRLKKSRRTSESYAFRRKSVDSVRLCF